MLWGGTVAPNTYLQVAIELIQQAKGECYATGFLFDQVYQAGLQMSRGTEALTGHNLPANSFKLKGLFLRSHFPGLSGFLLEKLDFNLMLVTSRVVFTPMKMGQGNQLRRRCPLVGFWVVISEQAFKPGIASRQSSVVSCQLSLLYRVVYLSNTINQ